MQSHDHVTRNAQDHDHQNQDHRDYQSSQHHNDHVPEHNENISFPTDGQSNHRTPSIAHNECVSFESQKINHDISTQPRLPPNTATLQHSSTGESQSLVPEVDKPKEQDQVRSLYISSDK